MKFTPATIEGVVVVDIERRVDERGFFARQWCADEMQRAGLDPRLAQINTSRSTSAGTLRGIHFQRPPHMEVKLVRCVRGAVFDVAVDLRPASKTYCQWAGFELNAEDGRMLYIPEGCGHGFLTLTPDADLVYQTSIPYAGASASGVRHDDQAFGISWPREIAVISSQDQNWPAYDKTRATAGV